MSSGVLNDEQREAIQPFVADAVVHDFGAGDLLMAHSLIELGAKRIICIDRHPMPNPETNQIECWEGHYENFLEHARSVDVALLSWPVNWGCCLEPFVWEARVVIYLGKCTDGSMCGYPGLWRALTAREVLAHSPDRQSTLIVYGPKSRPYDRLLPEEYAATYTEKMWAYHELMLAMRPTRRDRLLDEPYSAKPDGPTPLPEEGSLWARMGHPGPWQVTKVPKTALDGGIVVLAPHGGTGLVVNWWNDDERAEWSPV